MTLFGRSPSPRTSVGAWFMAAWSVATTGARAAGPDDEPLLEDIPSVYGASKYDQRQTEAPSSVSVITADEISQFGYRTLDDILRGVRGLYVTSDLQYTYIGVRGSSRSGDYTGLVLVLVDGHRLNEPLYDQPALGHYFPVDIALVERVEVIRGPTSSLYGTNAFHAVVNVITKRGRDLDGVRLGMEVLSNGSWLGRITGGARFGDELELSAGVAFASDPGDTVALGELGTFDGLDDEQALQASLKLSWRQLTFMSGLGTSRRGVPTGPYGSVIGSARTFTDDLYFFADTRWADHWERFDLEVRLYVDHYLYHADFEYDSGVDDPATVMNHDRGNSDALGAQLQANFQASRGLRLSFGAELEHAFSVGQNNHDVVVYLDDEHTTTSGGLFAQGEWDIVPALSLNAALRLDGYDTFGFELSPRAALIVGPSDETTFKLLAGRAFRAPNQYELHYANVDVAKPAGELDPEHIESYEIVWEQRIAEPLRAVVSGFHWRMSDLIEYGVDPADGLSTFTNRGSATAWGFEAQLDASWLDGPAGALSYSFVDARDGDGRWPRNSPRHQLKLQLAVPIVARLLVAGLTCNLTSPRKTKTGDETGWVPLVGLTLSSRDLVDGLELAVHADNLLDYRYGDPATDDLVMTTVPQPGMRAGLTAAYRF